MTIPPHTDMRRRFDDQRTPHPPWQPAGMAPWPAPPPSVAAPPLYGWTPTASPGRHLRRRWLLAGAAVLAIAGVVTGLCLYTTGRLTTPASPAAAGQTPTASPVTTSAAAPEKVVGSEALLALILGPDDLNSLLAIAGLHIADSGNGDGPFATVKTDRPDCGGAAVPALHETYDGSGYLAMQVRTQTDGVAGQYSHRVTQVVATYPSTQAAEAFVNSAAERWGRCAYKVLTRSTQGQPDTRVTVLQPGRSQDVLTVSTTEEGANGWGCQHGLTSERNVVVDVEVCSYSGSAQAAELARHIAGRIPAV